MSHHFSHMSCISTVNSKYSFIRYTPMAPLSCSKLVIWYVYSTLVSIIMCWYCTYRCSQFSCNRQGSSQNPNSTYLMAWSCTSSLPNFNRRPTTHYLREEEEWICRYAERCHQHLSIIQQTPNTNTRVHSRELGGRHTHSPNLPKRHCRRCSVSHWTEPSGQPGKVL